MHLKHVAVSSLENRLEAHREWTSKLLGAKNETNEIKRLVCAEMPTLLGDSTRPEKDADEEQNSSSYARRSLIMAKMLDDRLENTNSIEVEEVSSDVSASMSAAAIHMGSPPMALDMDIQVDDNRAHLEEMDSAIRCNLTLTLTNLSFPY